MNFKNGSIIQHKRSLQILEIINNNYWIENAHGNNQYIRAKVLQGYFNYKGEIVNIPIDYMELYDLIK